MVGLLGLETIRDHRTSTGWFNPGLTDQRVRVLAACCIYLLLHCRLEKKPYNNKSTKSKQNDVSLIWKH